MHKYSKIFVILAMLPLILGQPLWIYHSVSQSIFLFRYGEEFYDAINGLWMYADLLISIMLLLISVPFVYLAYRTGEKWIKRKFIIWLTIAFTSPLIMIGIRFTIEMKFEYFTLLQIIPPAILFILPIYWINRFWYPGKSNNIKLIDNNSLNNA